MPGKVVVLAGGVGAARFLDGLAGVIPAADITVIGNTGDDLEVHGLSVSPDLDTLTYTLAGVVDPAQGWGLAGDTFECLDHLERFGSDTWFRLGDRDLATHIYRTSLLRSGLPLSDVTLRIGRSLGVRSRIIPMSNDRVRTWVETGQGRLDFQTYFVKRQARDQVNGVEFVGAETAQPAPDVVEEIRVAKAVIVAPSNPIISIGPILAVHGHSRRVAADHGRRSRPSVRSWPAERSRVPTARMMEGLGMEASAFDVAGGTLSQLCQFLRARSTGFRTLSGRVEALGMKPVVTDTVMASSDISRRNWRERLCGQWNHDLRFAAGQIAFQRTCTAYDRRIVTGRSASGLARTMYQVMLDKNADCPSVSTESPLHRATNWFLTMRAAPGLLLLEESESKRSHSLSADWAAVRCAGNRSTDACVPPNRRAVGDRRKSWTRLLATGKPTRSSKPGHRTFGRTVRALTRWCARRPASSSRAALAQGSFDAHIAQAKAESSGGRSHASARYRVRPWTLRKIC